MQRVKRADVPKELRRDYWKEIKELGLRCLVCLGTIGFFAFLLWLDGMGWIARG